MNKNVMLLPLIFASSMTVSLSAFATKGAAYVAPTHTNDSYYHSGFYLGGAIGANQYLANTESNVYAAYESTTFSLLLELGSYDDLETESKALGFMGQAQLGYAYINDWFFLAGEISGNGTTGSNNLDQDTPYATSNSLEGTFTLLRSDLDIELNSWEPVVDIKIGFKVTPNSLLYARVGAAFNEIQVKEKLNLDINYFEAFDVLSSLESTHSDSVVGLRLGVGGEHRFSENLAATLDYVYTDYGSVNVSGMGDSSYYYQGDIETFEDGLAFDSEVNVKRNVVMLGMNYYF
jgi:opacity protein-like surface antigen